MDQHYYAKFNRGGQKVNRDGHSNHLRLKATVNSGFYRDGLLYVTASGIRINRGGTLYLTASVKYFHNKKNLFHFVFESENEFENTHKSENTCTKDKQIYYIHSCHTVSEFLLHSCMHVITH